MVAVRQTILKRLVAAQISEERTLGHLRGQWVRVDGAWKTLRWLLGMPGQTEPLAVPERHPDGTVLSADNLYERVATARPWAVEEPEQRIELRNRMEKEARRAQQFADVIARAKILAAS